VMAFFESPSRFRLLLEHDVSRKPVPTFRHHALISHTAALAPTLTRAHPVPISAARFSPPPCGA
jgi:hypothetical protein